MKHTLFLFGLLALLPCKNQAQTTVTDIDSNVYNTVIIGTQVWMKENLKVTHYSNGNIIPNITNAATWITLTTGAYCDYYNTPSYSTTYGKLYNWYAATDTNKVCPTGWHVPSVAEWNMMEKYLDYSVDTTTVVGYVGIDIGGKLKETGTAHWNTPNMGATNSSEFGALPGGYININGTFGYIGELGLYWTATSNSISNAWVRDMSYNNALVHHSENNKVNGFSVRCVSDYLVTQINENGIDKQIQIYPNPAKETINIRFNEEQKNATIRIMDIMGKEIRVSHFSGKQYLIERGDMQPGVYIVQITDEKGNVINKKIIVQ